MSLLILIVETLLAPLAALGVVLAFLVSPKRGRLALLWEELPERLGYVPLEVLTRLEGRATLWLHAASAGEVGGLVPLVEVLSRLPNAPGEGRPPALVLTTTTRSGRDAARALPGVAWAQLAPLDAWPCIRRFLSSVCPTRLILAETELWPSTLILAAAAGLAPCLINARLTEKSLSQYRLISVLLSPVLRALSLVAAQTEDDAERFRTLGVPPDRLRVTGNAKYDRTAAPAAGDAARAFVTALGWEGASLFVAGSTHPVEEEIVLSAYKAVRRQIPSLRLVLAPRHLERCADTAMLLSRAGLRVVRWSEAQPSADDRAIGRGSAASTSRQEAAVLLLDAMGVLPSFYPLARAAFVGGTLVPVGGHNLLEPALAGVPVLFGPHTGHIEHPAELLAGEGGGGRRVRDAAELAARLSEFGRDEHLARAAGATARRTAARLQGATARTLAALDAMRLFPNA